MKFFFLALLLPVVAGASTYESPDQAPTYAVQYEVDTTLGSSGKVSIVCLQFQYDGKNEHTLIYGYNDVSKTENLGEGYTFSFPLDPASYAFRFLYNDQHLEIETDSIEVRPGFNTVIYLNFEPAYRPIKVKKPVIYLYPEVITTVSVNVKPVGKMTFTYPDLKDGWQVTAHPGGELTVGGKSYPYLFWESAQERMQFFVAADTERRGFVVAKETAVAFLEEKLTAMGLNAKEQADFITFWGPQLTAHDQCMVQFIVNEACDAFAELVCSPQPDHVNRLYMIWQPVGNQKIPVLSPQQLPVFDRTGFDVLEWGGSEIPPESLAERIR